MDNREKLELLRNTVLAAAQQAAEETEAQTKKMRDETVAAEKKRLEDEIAEIKSMSYDELRAKDEKELISKEAKMKKNLLVRREEYMTELFSELETKLSDFRKTEEYGDYISKAFSLAENEFGAAPDFAYCRKGERDFFEKRLPSTEIREDSSVTLGGVIFGKGNLLLDFSFDNRVAKEKSDFINGGKLRLE